MPKVLQNDKSASNVFWQISRETANCFVIRHIWICFWPIITEFMTVQHLQNEPPRKENGFVYAYISKYNRSTQKCPDTFKSTYKELSKWGVCIIYVLALYTLHYICLKNCNICLKNYSRYEIEFSYVVRHLQKQPTNSGRVTDLKNLLLLFELSCFFLL